MIIRRNDDCNDDDNDDDDRSSSSPSMSGILFSAIIILTYTFFGVVLVMWLHTHDGENETAPAHTTPRSPTLDPHPGRLFDPDYI